VSRIASDAVALAKDGPAPPVFHGFDPRTPLTPRQVRMFKASNALWRHGAALFHFWQIAGGSFAEPGTTRHAVKP